MFRRRRPAGGSGDGSRSPAEGAAAGDAREAAEQGGEEQTSQALAVLLKHLERGRKTHILDLGPASGDNLAFFSRLPARLYFEDLHATLAGRTGSADRELLARLLPFSPSTRFDLVLSWDLFNYLDRDTLAALHDHLLPFCQPDAMLHALVAYRAEIPEVPLRFKLIDEKTLLYCRRVPRRRPAPRYNTGDLARMMPAFSVRTTYLLRNGMQEFLLVREGGGSLPAESETPPPASA